MQATAIRRRVRSDVVRLAHRSLGVEDFAHEAATVVRRAVPADGVCLLTLDPATLLPTGEYVEGGLPAEVMPRLGEIERREPDVNKFTALAQRPVPAASLSAATRGDLDRSRRQRELRGPSGFADELRVALRDASGTWAALTLLRARGRPHFTDGEVRLLASIAGVLADGVRRALVVPAVAAAAPTGGHGLLVLAPDGTVEMANRAADRWLDSLGADHGLPAVMRAVADRARADGDHLATARVRGRTGVWLVVRGSLLGDGPDARVAVQVEAARTPELAPLLVAAYGLTERERVVTELVARGLTTNQIAARLRVGAYTVQDHLKSIFHKSGTGSRGELVARLFLDHMPALAPPPPSGRDTG